MSRKRNRLRRIRFELLEDRKVLDASCLIAAGDAGMGADPTAADGQAQLESVVEAESENVSVASASAVVAAQSGGTLTLDDVILGGVRNDLVISLGETPLVNTELSGTIDIGTATGNGSELTGFAINGGLVNASDAGGLIELTGISAVPLDINPGINPVSGGTFDASEVGISINNGIASIPALELEFDFSETPIEGPGTGTGTIVVNDVNGDDYDVTVSIPVALQLEAAPGVIANVDGNIVASGVLTVAPDPAETMSGFYNEIKQSIGSDLPFGDLILASKAAIDSGDVEARQQLFVDAYVLTADLSAAAVNAYDDIAAGITHPDELDYLYRSVTVVIEELEALRDFLANALASPEDFDSLTDDEFFAAAVQYVQQSVFATE